jgi:hypothetical protein
VFPGLITGRGHNFICFGYSNFANNDAAYPVQSAYTDTLLCSSYCWDYVSVTQYGDTVVLESWSGHFEEISACTFYSPK